MADEWISGNIYIRPNPLPRAGDRVDGHTHNFDHTTIVFVAATEGGQLTSFAFTVPAS